MNTYLTFNNQLRIETDESIIENLKRKGWQETEQPFYNPETETCQWQDGQWVIRETIPPLYTAEEWIQEQGYTAIQIQALTRLEANILSSNKSLGPIMTGVKNWFESIMFESALNPIPRADWSVVPSTYANASQEAVQILST